MALPGRADLSWSFEAPYLHPDAIDGVYGYVFPSKASPGQTPRHTATLSRVAIGNDFAAKLNFRLDGTDFPAAGFGIMFDDARPIDLRGLTSLRVTLRSDRPRKIRLALMSADPLLRASADTGLTFGRDTIVGASPIDWKLTLDDISWPSWATKPPAISREAILSQIFAIQFQVTCESKTGTCLEEDGWLSIDDLRLEGVGGAWPEPRLGDCSGEKISIDTFSTGLANRNDLGGWWYAYTDRSSLDSSSLGNSRILNATIPESAQTWLGPTQATREAALRFQLLRRGVYSGYAAMETQLAPPVQDTPKAADFPNARSLGFTLSFDEEYPKALGGIIVHLRKSGKDFQGGADHQVRVPWLESSRRWCLDLSGFQQPSWSRWIVPFSPMDLAALSFEARLPAFLTEAVSGFRISDVALYGAPGTRVGRKPTRDAPVIRARFDHWEVQLPQSGTGRFEWTLFSLSGARVATGGADAGSSFSLRRSPGESVAFLLIHRDRSRWVLPLPAL